MSSPGTLKRSNAISSSITFTVTFDLQCVTGCPTASFVFFPYKKEMKTVQENKNHINQVNATCIMLYHGIIGE